MNKTFTQSPPDRKLASTEQQKEENWQMKYLRATDRLINLLEENTELKKLANLNNKDLNV